ncbi:MAG: DHH family phosphoesterase [Oscillospiraceae bacterium]|nr:DHH family phosphoesterase [Oscillospiraceae bacterium]
MNNKLQRLAEPGSVLYLAFLVAFAAASLFFRQYTLALAEAALILLLLVYSYFARKRRKKQLAALIEEVAYDTENAKNNTLMNFPLPIAVFRLDDSRIVWGNEMFFGLAKEKGSRVDARISDLVPDFSGKWLLEGKNRYPSLMQVDGRKYQIHGNIIRSDRSEEDSAFMGITYWVDVTEYDDIRLEYEASRPVAAVIVIDNLDEMSKNQTDRVRNDIRDSAEDKLNQWCEECHGIIKRYGHDRYLMLFERRYLEPMKASKFQIVEDMHTVASPNGITATISIGLGVDAAGFGEALQFANMGVELALSRGGDQTVVKNRLSFEFYGGRGSEVEKRTKVKSRVVATTLAELVRDSSRVLVMGHRFADLDSVGAAVGVCCLARKCGVRANIVIDQERNASETLIARLKKESEYKDCFMAPDEAMLRADGRTLLVVVDINRPNQVEDPYLLESCNRVAVIDHHRVGANYIQNAALSFIEPYASSACELLTEILQEAAEPADILRCEAEAILSGIVLDTKSFTIRTGERTFDAAAYLRRCGADTADVKRLLQRDMSDAVAKYRIMQGAELYRGVALAVAEEPQNRVVVATAADELLNISGVDASTVVAQDDKGNVFVSARSIGEMNVQILMEKLGGGGNRSAAAAQFGALSLQEAAQRVRSAIDEYLDN